MGSANHASTPPSAQSSDQQVVLDGQYELLSALDSGGIGIVYHGRHLFVRREVAIKVLHETCLANESLTRRFEREARVLASVTHPQIVNMIDYGVADQRPYLVMELLEGRTVKQLLEQGPAAPDVALSIALQTLEALDFAHRKGLWHRDIKPANVFLQRQADGTERVKLLDFGFAKLVSAGRSVGPACTGTGVAFGTPAYMTPEQASSGQTDARTDVYAVGVLLFEMLAGRRPFEGQAKDILKQKLTKSPPRLRDVAPHLQTTRELEQALAHALAPAPGARFQSASEFLLALQRLPHPAAQVRDEQAASETATATPPTPSTRAPRTVTAWAVAIVIVTAALATAAVRYLQAAPPREAARSVDASTAQAAGGEMDSEHTGPLHQPPHRPEDLPKKGLSRPSLWAAPGPGLLSRARQQLLDGQTFSDETIERLIEYARTHRDDPRPHILVAHAYRARGWRTDSLSRYQLAFKVDPAAAEDPAVLAGLLGLTAHGATATEAIRTIVKMYGPAARPIVQKAVARPDLKRDQKRRLTRLLRQLPQQ